MGLFCPFLNCAFWFALPFPLIPGMSGGFIPRLLLVSMQS